MAELSEGPSPDNELARLSERVSETVEREQQRRKRLLVVYLILLLIPLAVWIWVVSTQSQNKEQRELEVASVVDGRVAELEPALASIQAIEPQLSELSNLHTQLKGLEDDLEIVQRVEPTLASMQQTSEAQSARIAQLEAQQTAMQDSLAGLDLSTLGRLAQTVQDLDAGFQSQTRRLEAMSTGQVSLLAGLEELRGQTAASSTQNQEALQAIVARLKGQISELETGLSGLEARTVEHASRHDSESVGQIEALLESLRQRVGRLETRLTCPDGDLHGSDCPVTSSVISIGDFQTGSAKMPDNATQTLVDPAAAVAADPAARIRIVGHTDDMGDEALNNELSLARATEVWRFLLEQGVSATQLELHAAGEKQPVEPNDRDEGRRQNRRVELVITGM